MIRPEKLPMLWNTAIVGTVVASGASLLSLINSKEAKISEFRQQWIDALREDLTILITAAIEAEADLHLDNSKLDEALGKANLVATRIGLRLNQSEPTAQDLLGKLAKLRDALHDFEVMNSEKSFAEVQSRAQAAIASGRDILKAEWVRVKTGEPTYKWTRRLLLTSFLVFLLILLFDFVRPDALDRIIVAMRNMAGYHV